MINRRNSQVPVGSKPLKISQFRLTSLPNIKRVSHDQSSKTWILRGVRTLKYNESNSAAGKSENLKIIHLCQTLKSFNHPESYRIAKLYYANPPLIVSSCQIAFYRSQIAFYRSQIAFYRSQIAFFRSQIAFYRWAYYSYTPYYCIIKN
jgi:hypothetical protein